MKGEGKHEREETRKGRKESCSEIGPPNPLSPRDLGSLI